MDNIDDGPYSGCSEEVCTKPCEERCGLPDNTMDRETTTMTDEEMRKGLKTAMEVFRGGYEAGFKAANPSAGILLAACKFALTNLENMTTDDFSLAADLPIRKALRAAINKAEGREENTDA